MSANDCIAFLKWSLPRLSLRWAGYRTVRRTLCKRIRRRLRELELPDLAAYREFLAQRPGEWQHLDALCRIPISRFLRDRPVFETLAHVLDELAAGAAQRPDRSLWAWSAGCASGEEAYSLRLIWAFGPGWAFPTTRSRVLGPDADETMLRRARAACYPAGSLRELPDAWRARAFAQQADGFCLRPEFTTDVDFLCQDVRAEQPPGPFDLILCRNLVFTYFDGAEQDRLLRAIDERLVPGGVLVLGRKERLPQPHRAYRRVMPRLPIYRKEYGG